MARYIDADEILKHQRKIRGFGISPENDFWDYAVLIEDIQNAPTADVAEVKHGEWLYFECVSSHDGAISGYGCSVCSAFVNEDVFDTDEFHKKYCGCCGAKMDGKELIS